MAIEVKQLLIKSSVLPEGDQANAPTEDHEDELEKRLAGILEECREMITEMLRKERER